MAGKKKGLELYSGTSTKKRVDSALDEIKRFKVSAKKPKATPKAPVSKPSRGGLSTEELWLQNELKKARAGQ